MGGGERHKLCNEINAIKLGIASYVCHTSFDTQIAVICDYIYGRLGHKSSKK